MERIIQSELLDHLSPTDAGARHSRRDLRRINRLMGNGRALHASLVDGLPSDTHRPWTILEAGAGDGAFAARVWCHRPAPPAGSRIILLDRLSVIDPDSASALASRGWTPEIVVQGIEAWMESSLPDSLDLIYANLFAHHFDRPALAGLLSQWARLARTVILIEPRRSRVALWGAHLLGFIGCHAITRHDAVRSVEAGFRGCELTDLWPDPDGWILSETAVGAFGHRFSARRRSPP